MSAGLGLDVGYVGGVAPGPAVQSGAGAAIELGSIIYRASATGLPASFAPISSGNAYSVPAAFPYTTYDTGRTDGSSLTQSNNANSIIYSAYGYNGTTYVAFGGDIAATSTDGINFTASANTLPKTNGAGALGSTGTLYPSNITYFNGQWVVLATGNGYIHLVTSPDLITWTLRWSFNYGNWSPDGRVISIVNGFLHVAVGFRDGNNNTGQPIYYTSTNGTSWTLRTTGSFAWTVTDANNFIVTSIVGKPGAIYASGYRLSGGSPNYASLWKSTDDGASWTDVGNALRTALSGSSLNILLAVYTAADALIVFTQDKAAWTTNFTSWTVAIAYLGQATSSFDFLKADPSGFVCLTSSINAWSTDCNSLPLVWSRPDYYFPNTSFGSLHIVNGYFYCARYDGNNYAARFKMAKRVYYQSAIIPIIKASDKTTNLYPYMKIAA